MQPVNRWIHGALRLYSLAGAGLVLLFLPGYLYKLGTERRQPVKLESIPRSDGSVSGRVAVGDRPTRIAAVSIGGGAWVPAGGLAAARQLAYLPPGTPLSYREAGVAGGAIVTGVVTERDTSRDRVVGSIALALVAVVLCLGGAGMALAGLNRPSLYAAAFLAGFGQFAGALFLEPNASMVADPAARNWVVLLWVVFPRNFGFLWLASFLSVFPSDLWTERISRVSRGLLATLAIVQAVSVTTMQIPGTWERLPTPLQALALGGHRQLAVLPFVIGLLASLWLVVLQARVYRRHELTVEARRRAEILAAGLLTAILPCSVPILVQAVSIIFLGRFLISSVVMSLFFLPLVVIPPALAYSVATPRVQTIGVLVRKAVLFTFAERTVRVVSFLPLAALALFLYTNRQSRLDELAARRPVPLVVATGLAVIGLRYGDRARAAVERLFFRRRGVSTRILRDLAEKARGAGDVAELAWLLTTETDAALGLESIALFVHDQRSASYVCPGRALPPLEATSMVVEAALHAGSPLDVDLDDPSSPLHGAPELDRGWIEECQARLLIPLIGSDGSLLALLALGEKLSELPYDAEDKQLLSAAAASGALALENRLLRSSGASTEGGVREGTAGEDTARPEPYVGLYCRLCSRIFSPTSTPICPEDETRLEPADVPYLLSEKYRFERRIGSGGMGVVYRARDLPLARDVAIKTLPRLSVNAARRLRREARAAARLIHPNLGLIFAAEAWRGTPMLVFEYLDGGTLEGRIARGPIPFEHVVGWGIQLASALEAVHARGLLHRDIKPTNVGFTRGGVPKLLDFGLVRILDDPEPGAVEAPVPSTAWAFESVDAKHPTATGMIVGTVPYLSPEAGLGETPRPSFDLWGLSLTLYEAVVGVNPFLDVSAERSFNRVLNTPLADPRTVRPDCPEPLARLFADALSRSERDRPATARELRERLEDVRKIVS